MKIMKRILAIIMSVCIAFSLVSCSQGDSNESTAPQTTTVKATASVTTAYPLTVTDQLGREVTINEKPERLVSGYYISTSTMIALGLEKSIVGIEAKAKTRPIYELSAPELINLPNVGSAKKFDLEGCAALKPDLAILPAKLKDTAKDLEALGITVMFVNPETQEQLEKMIALIGKATDTQKRANELLSFISEQRDSLSNMFDSKPTVYIAGNSSFLSTAGSKMYQSDMISLAGGKNVADEITDTYWAEIDYEQFLKWNPDYIILASDSEYTVEDVLNDKSLSEAQAVKNGNVYQMPSETEAWDSPIPAGILGSVWLSSIIHSDKMTTAESDKITEAFYKEFYDFTITKK